jgi:hypothetical protein
MNLQRQRDGNLERLRQIVLTMLALAVLADCAKCRPLHIRLHVFRILRRAEYAAVALFIDTCDGFSAEALRSAKLCDEGQATRDNLIRLAFSLRTMAALLVVTQLSSTFAARQLSTAKFCVGNHPRHICTLPAVVKHDTS